MHQALYKPFKLQSGSLTLEIEISNTKAKRKIIYHLPHILLYHPVTTEMPLRGH